MNLLPQNHVEISAKGLPSTKLVIWHVDCISEAWYRQPRSKDWFTMAEICFGASTKVIWLVSIEDPFLLGPGTIHGFPILYRPDTNEFLGLDGEQLSVRKVDI